GSFGQATIGQPTLLANKYSGPCSPRSAVISFIYPLNSVLAEMTEWLSLRTRNPNCGVYSPRAPSSRPAAHTLETKVRPLHSSSRTWQERSPSGSRLLSLPHRRKTFPVIVVVRIFTAHRPAPQFRSKQFP